jgi:drug/metabolite transporter (DMT)-like permease
MRREKESLTVVFGLIVALLWGSADTMATLATRKIGSATTTFVAQLAGFLLCALLGLVLARPSSLIPSLDAFVLSILFGVLLGGISASAYLALYKSLEYGPLAVVSPIVSAQGGVTLVLALCVLHESLHPFQLFFLLVTFIGVLLASIPMQDRIRIEPKSLLSHPGIASALVALVCFGLLSFGLGLAAREANWLLSTFWMRCFSFVFLASLLRLSSPQTRPSGRMGPGYLLAALTGCADIGGLALLSLATLSGSIGVAGMLASAYGMVPLLVGILFLKERPGLHQILGGVLLGLGVMGEAAPGYGLSLFLVWLAVTLLMIALLLLLSHASHVFLTATGGMGQPNWFRKFVDEPGDSTIPSPDKKQAGTSLREGTSV